MVVVDDRRPNGSCFVTPPKKYCSIIYIYTVYFNLNTTSFSNDWARNSKITIVTLLCTTSLARHVVEAKLRAVKMPPQTFRSLLLLLFSCFGKECSGCVRCERIEIGEMRWGVSRLPPFTPERGKQTWEGGRRIIGGWWHGILPTHLEFSLQTVILYRVGILLYTVQ